MDHIKLTVDKLSVEDVSDLVASELCGAISLFVGTTRDNFEGKQVVSLEYEAYESMAVKSLKSICDDMRIKWPNLHHIAIYHRLGTVPAKEASVVIAVSSPHRRDALDAVSHCIDQLKATVPIWKKEKYVGDHAVWKENKECLAGNPAIDKASHTPTIDKSLIQINVSSEEIKQRIDNFISRKREQVNVSNIHDFIPQSKAGADGMTCARVRTQFVKRKDCKGHLKVRKVVNEWGPQTMKELPPLPPGVADRVRGLEARMSVRPVAGDIYRRLKHMEDKLADLQAMSPEYAQFWKRKSSESESSVKKETDYSYSALDIERKIELLEQGEL